jgi:mannose-6-phosphate isomerase-like protein (cupin superfamily)
MQHFDLETLADLQRRAGAAYHEFLRVPSMSLGLYALGAGATDPQTPHEEDEIYHVLRGRGRIRVGADDRAVEPGSVVFVGAREEHRFHSINEDLLLLVFFAPAEGTASGPSTG